jgi:uncharacterized protein YceH (UPF0502 family)
MYQFGVFEELHGALDRLIERELVVRLPRRPGQKEERYAQLLGGDAEEAPARSAATPASDLEERIADLEERVAELERRLVGDDSPTGGEETTPPRQIGTPPEPT